jgi:hypothetical protein
MRGSGDWLASEADREQAVEVLRVAFVERRLTKDEFVLRIGRALAALTYADLDALTADIPAEPQPRPVTVKAQRGNPEPSATPSDLPPTHALTLVAQAAWARRQLVALMAGLLLLVGGLMLPNPIVLVVGLVVVGVSAPQAAPSNPQSATVQTWQWLHHRRRGPLTPNG